MRYLILLMLALGSTASVAQTGQKEMTNYSAERVMKYRSKIGLDENQAEFIKKVYNQNSADFNNLKWDLDEANLQLSELLTKSKVDSEAAMKLMEKVMALETEIKKKRLSVFLSIKNQLSIEQQELLADINDRDEIQVIDPKVELKIKNKGGSNGNPIYIINDSEGTRRVKKMKEVDPDEIESIEVLKGEAAKKKYGEEGKNGVIIITMKNQ